MKNLLNILGLFLLMGGMFMMTSCGDDDVVITGGQGSVNASDGMYLALDGENPSATAALVAEQVEADDFLAQDRDGFTAGYMWLAAGDYNLVTVVDQEVTGTIGGVAEVVDDANSDCGFTTYTLVKTEANGPAFNVATAGLYKVTNDQMTNEITMFLIDSPSLIGSATENGWGADTPMTGSVTADGGSWTLEGTTLRSGEWKVRFNCRWQINRRIDPNGILNDAANGYQLFTNFGGTTNSLVTGGSNIQQEEDGIYTVTVTWDPRTGFALSTEKTGDAPVITFNPNDFNMAVIGDATANGWDADRNLFYKGLVDGAHTWLGMVTLAGEGEFKFRANDAWDLDIGGDINNLEIAGANMPTLGEGSYYVTLSTADEGGSWTASMVPATWGLIGAGGPGANWDDDVDMTSTGFDMGMTSHTFTGSFAGGEWKFRANDAWDLNFGGDASFLTLDGGNLNLAAGDYTVTLLYNGETYSATIQ
jgi:hypothetical protein